MSNWALALIIYSSLALLSFLPVLRALVAWSDLNPGGPSFNESPHFTQDGKLLLGQNYERMQGTLKFWKTQAERYRLFHVYSLTWISLSSVGVPLLAQATTADPWSKWLLTVVATHSALLLGISRAFRVEAHYKAFRSGESEFYDIYRRMLDRPGAFGATQREQIDKYFEQVEAVRKIVRNAETDNFPSVEDISQGSVIDRPEPRTGNSDANQR
ncbi:hypothetical protein EJ357_34965 [Streptomyces cyaneochromogenes]|uniref:DUF4231 domain-containing protein n=1 Tax=Streptomyces cyaneochromogenes TaxID=2496836 RepID=A0A3Q9EXB6_9ACTN|nr:hypothetical protein [Streptomyces cyaneochromogenes]AZQ38015.1 hypothetical protein EJ357_34965 [Streptomyces cyaneochromogenes]